MHEPFTRMLLNKKHVSRLRNRSHTAEPSLVNGEMPTNGFLYFPFPYALSWVSLSRWGCLTS